MKKFKTMGYLAVTLTFLAVTILSCSSDYDYSSDVDLENLDFITLKTEQDKLIYGVNETATFSVFDDESGEEITEAANFYIDGEAISGNYATFEEPGTYVFTATVEGLTTNTLTVDVVGSNYVTVSINKVFPGETVSFRYFDTAGFDLTESAAFFVNETSIANNTFTSETEGIYTVTAIYQGQESENVAFEVYVPKRKVTFEDYTGAWCGWCPRVATAGHELQELSDHVVVLAVHNNDEMAIEQESQLRDAFDIIAFPAARLNRTIPVPNPEDGDTALNMVLENAGTPTNTSIAIDTKQSGTQLKITAKVRSIENLPASYKVVVYLYQDGLVFPQVNYYDTIEGSPWYDLGNPIEDFVHNEVLETSLTNLFGDPMESTPAYEEYTVAFNPVDLSNYGHTDNGNTFDPERFGVVVMLVDENNEALNAQRVHVGESVGYE